jgi:hypothetical protein
MDSNFFNKNASKIQLSTLYNNNNNLNEEKFDRNSISSSINQNLNYSQNEENYTNNNLGQKNNIVMKKIILMKPETKENRSEFSKESSVNCKI